MTDAAGAPPRDEERVRIWRRCEDDAGRGFFHCARLRESRWDLPEELQDWLETDDAATGRKFYFNPHRKISTWEVPGPTPTDARDAAWVECVDSATGRAFFYNVRERKSVWQRPDDGLPVAPPAPAEDQGEAAAAGPVTQLSAEGHQQMGAGAGADAGAVPDDGVSDSEDEEEQEDEEKQGSAPDGEFHAYVQKEGGGTTLFGRKSWKRRFLVLKHGEIGWFRSYKEYAGGHLPLKGRWTPLSAYRLEEMLQDPLGVRLLPLSLGGSERVWNLRCEGADAKGQLMGALEPFTASRSFVKNLDRALSGRRFLSDFH